MNIRSFTLLLQALFCSVFFASCKDWSKVKLPEGEAFDHIRFLYHLQNKELDESSGLSLSRDGRMWSHNDSNGEACLFSFDSSGQFLKKLYLEDTENVDWEDLSTVHYGGDEFILVADTGNNWRNRKQSPIYVAPIATQEKQLRPIKFSVSFGGEVINCESVAYDESSENLFLLEKNYDESARLYYIDTFMTGAQLRQAQELCRLNLETATAMDIKGNKAAILTLEKIYLFGKKDDESWLKAFKRKAKIIHFPEILPQPEALCFSLDGNSILISSETGDYGLAKAPIYEILLEGAK